MVLATLRWTQSFGGKSIAGVAAGIAVRLGLREP